MGGHVKTDELRRVIEALPAAAHESWGYYDRWTMATVAILTERGVLAAEELHGVLHGWPVRLANGTDRVLAASALPDIQPMAAPQFPVGAVVHVLPEDARATSWRAPHLRTPGYAFGATGVIERHCGAFADPSFLAFGLAASPPVHLYRVRFRQQDLWLPSAAAVGASSAEDDTVDVEIYENWLGHGQGIQVNVPSQPRVSGECDDHHGDHHDGSDHDHDHDHSGHVHVHDDGVPHVHEARLMVERAAVVNEAPPSPGMAIHQAILAIALAKNLVTMARLRAVIDTLETAGRNLPGARLVVRAWTDPAFKARLLADAPTAALELGLTTSNPNAPTKLTVVANESGVHNLIVCTLCSCYPAALLGPSPAWYKSRSYRARAVRQPRDLLATAFGLTIPASTQVRVHDSTADLRYMVLPLRPVGSEGWTEDQLLALVTRDAMVGVALASIQQCKIKMK